jgi:PKD repeat protein
MKKFTFILLLFFIGLNLTGQNTLTVNISSVMNKTNPPSYTFSTDFKGEASKYLWYFGNEGSSELVSPTYTFKYTNTYPVIVKIIDKTNAVYYGKLEARFEGAGVFVTPCKALFTATIVPSSNSTIAGSKKVSFKNLSTGTIKACIWNFGDNTKSTELNPVHEYVAFGDYKVTLTIETTDSCKSEYSAAVKVADPSVSVILYAKGKVKDLSATTSCKWGIVLEAGIVLIPVEMAMEFAFRDGQYVELAYQYLPNSNTACQAGKTVKIHKIGEIAINSACKAYFTATNDLWSNPAMMKKMVFANNSTGDIKECKWTFGDGTTSAELQPVHEYPKYGEYKVCLNIVTTLECRSEYCAVVVVDSMQVPGVCSFDLVIKPKEQVKNTFLFYAVSKSEIKVWKWSFGDGKYSDAQNPEHAYEKTGTFEVTCNIVTTSGCSATRVFKLTVAEPALPVCPGAISLVLFDPASDVKTCNGKAIAALLNTDGKEYEGVKYSWSNGMTGNTATNLCANRQYYVNAVFDSKCQKNTSFAFLTSPTWKYEYANGKVFFTVLSPSDSLIYRWDFGDGNYAFGKSVEYNYAKEGNYDVKLSAISGNYSNYSSQKLAVLTNTTSVKELDMNKLTIFPNPVRDELWIDFKKPVTGAVTTEIIDMKGQAVSAMQFILNGQNLIPVQTSQLQNGIYFLRISCDKQVLNGIKFFKSK